MIDKVYLKQKIILGFALSLLTSLATSKVWELLSNDTQRPSLSIWFIWILYVTAQVFQWHYYYKILPRGKYGKLLCGIVIQISTTVLVMVLLGPNWAGSYPLSVLSGILISTIYLWQVAMRIGLESVHSNDKD